MAGLNNQARDKPVFPKIINPKRTKGQIADPRKKCRCSL